MTMKQVIFTALAPKPIGTYSQAIKVNNTIYFSGQIPKNIQADEMVTNDFTAETKQVFENIAALAKEAGGSLNHIVKLTVFLTDLKNFSVVNELMAHYFQEPFPARSTIQVTALPANARIEIEAIMVI